MSEIRHCDGGRIRPGLMDACVVEGGECVGCGKLAAGTKKLGSIKLRWESDKAASRGLENQMDPALLQEGRMDA